MGGYPTVSFRFLFGLALAFGMAWENSAYPVILNLPSTLSQELVSESVPSAFAPAPFNTRDFMIEWLTPPPPGAKVWLEPASLQWVRVSELLVLPRARMHIEIAASKDKPRGGRVKGPGFAVPLVPEADGRLSQDFLIPLLTGEPSTAEVRVVRGNAPGKEEKASFRIRFRPRPRLAAMSKVYLDPSCGRFGLSAPEPSLPDNEWAYVGCRFVLARGPEQVTEKMELLVYWDGARDMIDVQGVPTSPTIPSLWVLQVASTPETLELRHGPAALRLEHHFPERFHRASLGLGLGPYAYLFETSGDRLSQLSPLLTLYGSLFLNEGTRFVVFDATAINAKLNTDLGFYIDNESARVIDRRLGIHVMLGVHFIGVRTGGTYHLLFGAPQGFELNYQDAFLRGKTLSSGAFIYPPINGTSYYNAWLRWGGPVFLEFNYISWSEQIEDQHAFSRSYGLSLGFPLLSFF